MVTISRCAAVAVAAFVSSDCARMSRNDPVRDGVTKLMSGVPVHNYDQAYKADQSVLAEFLPGWHYLKEAKRWRELGHEFLDSVQGMLEEKDQSHWILYFTRWKKQYVIDVCNRHVECKAHGDPSGVPFIVVTASESQLDAIMTKEGKNIMFVEAISPVFTFDQTSATEIEVSETEVPWGLRRIRARSLSSMPSSDPGPANGGQGVNVYVLDTGVRTTHTEFGGRAKPAIEVDSVIFVKDCHAGGDPCAQDEEGHGTSVAATVAGANYGVAKGATIHSVKVLDANGVGSNIGVLNAVSWIIKNHQKPAVVTISLGSPGYVRSLIDANDELSKSGVTIVTAAGNADYDVCKFSPGLATDIITVGSLDEKDKRSSSSNYGWCLDIWAPGQNVLSAAHTTDDASSTYSGTSMAVPHVAGAAAIILAGEPTLDGFEVLEKLLKDATPDLVKDPKEGSSTSILYSAPA